MAQCKNCFLPIADLRTETKCTVCTSPLHKDCVISDNGTFYCDTCYTVKEETPVVVQYAIPDRIRRTYIETYRTCPYKFLKEVLEGIRQPPTCYTQVGIDLHILFEKATNDRSYGMRSMVEDFAVYWDAYEDSLFESEALKESMEVRASDSIKNFYASVLPTLPPAFMSEVTLNYSIGDDVPEVEFTMDLVTENASGGLDMHDWKTGGTMVGVKLSSDLQAPLYIKGVQNHFKRQIDSFTFYYLKDNKTRVFTRINDDEYQCVVGKKVYKISITDAIREVKSLFSQIKKGNFNIPTDTKKMYFACKMCHIKAAGQCKGADEQPWYLSR